jgi:hypothetical protein
MERHPPDVKGHGHLLAQPYQGLPPCCADRVAGINHENLVRILWIIVLQNACIVTNNG